MDISYFKEFVVLAKTQNYWAAAERLYIGQSSLSKHIKTLEKQLGAPLFDRSSRKIRLTEYGQKMLPYAQSISKLQFEYEAMTFNYLHKENEVLSIASIPAMPQYNIVDILAHFNQDYPSVQITTQEADTLVIRERLLEHKCDLAFIRDSDSYLEHDPDLEIQLAKLPFCQDYLVAVLPKEHPLANEEHLELPALKNENFAFLKKGSMPYLLCMRACQEAGFTPNVIFNSHHLDAIMDMVTRGNCVSLLFRHHVDYPLDSVLSIAPPFTAVPVVPEIQTTIYLAYLKDYRLSPAAEHFVDYCFMSRDRDVSVP